MKRILTLTSNDFYTGISAGSHVDRGGLWSEADGINVFKDITAGSNDAGLLQACSAPTDITGTLAGIPTDYAVSGTEMFFVTSAGDIGSVELTTTTTAVLEVDSTAHTFTGTTFAEMGTGCEFFAAQTGATRHLYYFCKIDSAYHIGRFNGSTDDADWYSLGTLGTTIRPIIRFKDRLYFGNKKNEGGTKNVACIGTIYSDSASTVTVQDNSLDFPDESVVTALSDDGTFLVAATTTNTTFNPLVYGDTKVYFWDTNSSSWNREFEIADTHIVAMKRVGGTIYALGGRGIWAFNHQTRPIKIRTLDTADTPAQSSFNFHGAISKINNAVLWGGGNHSQVYAYGEMMQGIGVQNVLHVPYEYTTDASATTMIAAEVKDGYMFTGNGNSKVYRWDIKGGTAATDVNATSVFIPLDDKTHVKEIELIFGEPLASGDSVNIDVQNDVDNAATDWGTASFATHGATQRVQLRGSKMDTENLRLIVNFTGGNPKIKRINVYGSSLST